MQDKPSKHITGFRKSHGTHSNDHTRKMEECFK